jgi:rhamnulokinase
MCDPVLPGTVIGKLTAEVQEKTGLNEVPVVAVGSHDTASAIASIPMENENCCYISSGTWCLMGVENREAIVTPEALNCNFTNEGGVDGTFRFLKNIMGLWLIQRLKGELAEDMDYGSLTEESSKSEPFRTLVDANDSGFFNPKSMSEAFRAFAEKSDQALPETVGQFVRCATESLALEVRLTLEELRKIVRRPMEKIHMTGGGVKNKLFCQMIADATGVPLLGGPIEATGPGNIMMQAIASGHISSVAEGRKVVANSFEMVSFEPGEGQAWDEAFERYKKLKG